MDCYKVAIVIGIIKNDPTNPIVGVANSFGLSHQCAIASVNQVQAVTNLM
jgi:hypothetical protein